MASVAGIGGLMNAIGLTPPATQTNPTQGVDAAGGANGNAFTNMLDAVQSSQNSADSLAVQAATGNLVDVHNYTIAATEAQLMTDLTVAVRDRAVESFNEIMRMQT